MKKDMFTPDKFMQNLYSKKYTSPFSDISDEKDFYSVRDDVIKKAEKLFNLDNIPQVKDVRINPVGKKLEFRNYSLQKYSSEICDGLVMAFYILTPHKVAENASGVVAICGHGYGVRQILGISKSGKKKKLPYIDNYQKNFACELAERGCVVIAPELFGFGEARLRKDLKKPFYISSCDELSHHLLTYGLTVASMRIFQAKVCADILLKFTSVKEENLSCMGISGGGLTALYASLLDNRISKTVVSGYINTFRDSILSLWHCPDNYIPDILNVGEIFDFASAIAPRKLLIESGKKDKLFPFDASVRAHDNIKKIYSLLGAQDNLITDFFDGKHSVSGQKSFDFLSNK